MQNNLLISIIIVGHNAGGYLPGCLESIHKQTYKDFEVIFINNGSIDATIDVLRSYPAVSIISNRENRGFCFANNQGIKLAKGEYVLTLNSDVILDKDFLLELKRAIKCDETGLFAAKILNSDGKAIDSAGLVLSRFYRFFDRGNGEKDTGQYDDKLDIFGPCAAAALYKREMLEDIKHNGEYFDEDFFFLVEDFDISWRALQKGWKARFVPRAICYHSRNSTNFNSKFRQYLSFRNRFSMLLKNRAVNMKYSIIFIFYDIPRIISMLFTNRYAFRALCETIKLAPRMRRKGAICKK